jgi:Fibronectin type III domain
MQSITKVNLPYALAIGLLLVTTLGVSALTIPPSGLGATSSGSNLILSFPTTNPDLFTVQTSPDMMKPWTSFQFGTAGDGTVKSVTLTNALSGSQGFYRLLIQEPADLLLPPSMAFAILGYDCGGIHEQAHVTGFDPDTGYPTGSVYLSTTCNGSGRGGHSTTHTAWAAVIWDFTGNVVSATALSTATTFNPTFIATDATGNTIYNLGTAAYLVVPLPASPKGVTAVQSEDQFQVSWMPMGINPAAVVSSTVTATPVNSTNPLLTTTVTGPAANAVISPLQPSTTYQISVMTASITGSSPASAPINLTSSPATIPPSASTNVMASWPNLDPTGTTDTLVATWAAAVPGNSPIDQYLVTITGSDSGGTFTNTVSGMTLTTYFSVDYIPNWSVTVQAHNAFGWGPVSSAFKLGGL